MKEENHFEGFFQNSFSCVRLKQYLFLKNVTVGEKILSVVVFGNLIESTPRNRNATKRSLRSFEISRSKPCNSLVVTYTYKTRFVLIFDNPAQNHQMSECLPFGDPSLITERFENILSCKFREFSLIATSSASQCFRAQFFFHFIVSLSLRNFLNTWYKSIMVVPYPVPPCRKVQMSFQCTRHWVHRCKFPLLAGSCTPAEKIVFNRSRFLIEMFQKGFSYTDSFKDMCFQLK